MTVLVVGAGIGLRDPWGVDEERFLGVALEMLQDGSWLIPHRAGEAYPDKPPLFMWVLAGAYWLLGSPRVAFRLPGLLAAVGCAICVYDIGRRFWNRRAAFAAGLLLVATIQSMLVLRSGQTDSLLILWTTLGMYGLLRHLTAGPAWGWYAAASVAMGLGVMTKGVGFLPFFLLYRTSTDAAAASAISRRSRSGIGAGCSARCACSEPWRRGSGRSLLAWRTPAIPMRTPTSGTSSSPRRPSAWCRRGSIASRSWYFLVQVIPLYWIPVVACLPWLVPAWRRRLVRGDGRLLLLIGWVALVVTFFSLSSGKRSLYVYPAVPALALAAAPVVAGYVRWLASTPGRRRLLQAGVAAWFVGMTAWSVAETFVRADDYPRRAVMVRVARRIGTERELALIHWRDGQWLFAQNPIVHFGYRGGGDQVGQALTWLRAAPDRWLLSGDRWLRDCFDMQQAIHAGEDRERQLFLVEVRMDPGRCPSEPIRRLYRFRWNRPYE